MRFVQTVWRAHTPRWSFASDSGEGAARHGGRFNRVGTPALYTSLRPETAWLEAQQGFPYKAQPLIICGYDVNCEDIADLTKAATRKRLGITLADLGCAWEDMVNLGQVPPSWLMADRLIVAGHAGIQVKSFAVGATDLDTNLVFWHWSHDLPHQILVIDDEDRLPKNDLSWK